MADEIRFGIRLSATDDSSPVVRSAASEFQKLSASGNTAAQSFKDLGNSVKDYNASFAAGSQFRNAVIDELEQQQKGFVKTKNAAVDAMKGIEEGAAKASFATSTVTRELFVMGREAVNGNWTRLGGSFTIFAQAAGLMQFALNPVVIGVAAITAGLGLLVYTNESAARSLNALQTGLVATGRGTAETREQMESLVRQLSLLPGVSKAAAEQTVTAFARTHQIGTELFTDLSALAVDFAAATGTKVPEAAKKLAAMFADPTRGAKELEAALGTLTAQEILHIEELQRQNNMFGAQQALLDTAKHAMAGLKDEGLTPLQTATNELYNAWNRMLGGIAQSEASSAAVRWLTSVVDWVTRVTNAAPAMWKALTNNPGLPLLASGAADGSRPNPTMLIAGIAEMNASTEAAKREATAFKALEDNALKLGAAYKSTAEHIREQNEVRKVLIDQIAREGPVTDANREVVHKLKSELDGVNEAIAKRSRVNDDGFTAAMRAADDEVEKAKIAYDNLGKTIEEKTSPAMKKLIELTGNPVFLARPKWQQEGIKDALLEADAIQHVTAWITQETTETMKSIAASEKKAEAEQKALDQIVHSVLGYEAKNEALARETVITEQSVAAAQRLATSVSFGRDRQLEEIAVNGQATLARQLLASTVEYETLVRTLNTEAARAGIAVSDVAIRKVREEYEARQQLITKGFNATQEIAAAKVYGDAWHKVIDDAQEGLSGFLNNVISRTGDAGKKAWESFKAWAFKALADIASKQILVSISSVASAGGAAGAAAQGLGGASNLLSGGSSLLGLSGPSGGILSAASEYLGLGTLPSLATAFGNLATIVPTFTTSLAAGASVVEAGTAAMAGTMASFIPVVGWIAAAALIAYQIFGQAEGGPKQGGAASGGIAGFNVYPGETNAANNATMQAAIDKQNSMFQQLLYQLGGTHAAAQFGLSYDTDPQGTAPSRVSVGATVGGQSVYSARDVNAGDPGDQASLQNAIATQADRALLAALKASDISQIIQDFLSTIDVNTATASEIEAALAHAVELKTVTDGLAQISLKGFDMDALTAFAQGSETIGQTWSRVGGAYLQFVDKFTTDSEKLQNAQNLVSSTFEAMGVTIPTSVTAYRELVQGIDLSTDAGRQMFSTLLTIAPQFLALQNAVTDTTGAIVDTSTAAKTYSDRLALQAQVYALTGDAAAAAAIQQEQHRLALDALNQQDPSGWLAGLQQQLWDLQDAAAKAAAALALQNKTLDLQSQILALGGSVAGATPTSVLQQQRSNTIDQLNIEDPTGSLAQLTAQLWGLQDAAEAAAAAQKLTTDSLNISAQINDLLGDKEGARNVLEQQRQVALDAMAPGLREGTKQLWDLQDAAKAAAEALAVQNEALNLQAQISALTGGAGSDIITAQQHANTLDQLNTKDPTGGLAALQEQLWGLQDAAKAAADALKLDNDKLNLLSQITALTGDAQGSADVLQQQHQHTLDQLNVEDPTGELAQLQQTLWGLEGAAKAATDSAKLYGDKLDVQAEIYKLTGDSAGAAAIKEQQRQIALANLMTQDPTGELAGLTQQLWDLQDAAAGVTETIDNTAKVYADRLGLLSQIYALSGDTAAAAAVKEQQRQSVLDGLNTEDPTGGLAELQTQLYGLQDATDAAATSAKHAADELANHNKSLDLQAQIANLTGDSAGAASVLAQQHASAIDQLNIDDPTGGLGALQQQLFDLQDAATHAAAAEKAAADAAKTYGDQLNLQAQIYALTGDSAAAAAVKEAQHQIILAQLNSQDETGGLALLQQQLWDLQGQADETATTIKATTDALKLQNDTLSLQAQLYGLTGDKQGAAAVVAQQHNNALDLLNAQDPSGGLAALQQQIWDLQATADTAAAALKLTNDSLSLNAQIADLTGDKESARNILEQQRAIALDALPESLRAGTQQLWDLQDAATATASAAKIAADALAHQNEVLDLQSQVFSAGGSVDGTSSADVLAQQRSNTIDSLNLKDPTGALAALQEQLWGLKDAADGTAAQLKLTNDSLALSAQIADLTGDKESARNILEQQRAIALGALPESLRAGTQQLWDLQDAATATATAAQAAADALALQNSQLDFQAQIYGLSGNAQGSADVLAQQRSNTIDQLNVKDPTGSLAALQQELWGLKDAADTAAAGLKLTNDSLSLSAQIDALTGDKAAARAILEQQRAIALDAVNPALRDATLELWRLQDAADEAATSAKLAADALKLQNDTLSLQAQLYGITGDTAGSASVLAQQHANALDQLNIQDPTGSLATLQQAIWDAAKAADDASAALKLHNDQLSLEGQVAALTGDKEAARNVLEQQHAIALDALNPALRDTQQAVWDLQAAADESAAALKLTNDSLSITAQIDELLGDKAGARAVLEQQRAIALEALNPALRAGTQELWDLQDAAAAAAAAAEIASKQSNLDIQVMQLSGDAAGALAAQRAIELASLKESLRPTQQHIYDLQDEAAAAQAAADAAKALAEIERQRGNLQIALMEAQGDSAGALAAKRQLELAALDESLRPLQEQIYAQQDLNAANSAAAKAADEAAAAVKKMISDLNALDNAALSYRQAVSRHNGGNDIDQAGMAFDNALWLMKRNVLGIQSLADALHLTDEQIMGLTPDQLAYVTAVVNTATGLDAARAALEKLNEQIRQTMRDTLALASADPLAEALAANATPWDKLTVQANALDALTAYYDGTAEATNTLSSATQQYHNSLVQMISTIETLKGSISSMFQDTVRGYQLDGLDRQGQYAYLQNEVDQAMKDLATATDPARINALAQLINADQKQAYGLLDPSQKTPVIRDLFIEGAKAANDLAQQQLQKAEKAATERNDKLVNDIRAVFLEFGIKGKETADKNSDAARTLVVAGEVFARAAAAPKQVNIAVTIDDRGHGEVTVS